MNSCVKDFTKIPVPLAALIQIVFEILARFGQAGALTHEPGRRPEQTNPL